MSRCHRELLIPDVTCIDLDRAEVPESDGVRPFEWGPHGIPVFGVPALPIVQVRAGEAPDLATQCFVTNRTVFAARKVYAWVICE